MFITAKQAFNDTGLYRPVKMDFNKAFKIQVRLKRYWLRGIISLATYQRLDKQIITNTKVR